MKKIFVLLAAEALLLLAAIPAAVLHSLATAVFIALALAFLGAAFFFLMQQARMMQFLIEKSRGNTKPQPVVWQEQDRQELQLIQKRIELSVLQNQINPHFLYNTLDSIRSRALMDGQKEIARMTEILSRFFRYCISNSDNLVKMREELNHIEDYYYIQKYRFEERFNMTIEVEDEEIYELYIPKMTLQPIVENAMVHGLEKSEKAGLIQLKIYRTDKRLIILVSDNGVGMSQESLIRLNERMQQQLFDAGRSKDRHNGIALSNVNARLKITFGEENGIHYRSMEGEGTDAVITMPVVDVFARVKYEDQFKR